MQHRGDPIGKSFDIFGHHNSTLHAREYIGCPHDRCGYDWRALGHRLDQHAAEGGCAGRLARYSANRDLLVAGLRGQGFRTLLPDDRQGPIIVTFHAPAHPGWDFERFYDALLARGFAIYPGKLTEAPTFRVGCIGQVFPDDMRRFVAAVAEVTTELGLGHADPKDGG